MSLQSPLRLCNINNFYVSLKKTTTKNLAFTTVQKPLCVFTFCTDYYTRCGINSELQKLLQVDFFLFLDRVKLTTLCKPHCTTDCTDMNVVLNLLMYHSKTHFMNPFQIRSHLIQRCNARPFHHKTGHVMPFRTFASFK